MGARMVTLGHFVTNVRIFLYFELYHHGFAGYLEINYFILIVACEKGFFGRNCSFVCSPNCETCRNTDGFCSCKAGWMQPYCSTGKCTIKNTTNYLA